MSDKEKKIYGVASILIVGMCLFPPWYSLTLNGAIFLDAGYSLIVSPPHSGLVINYGRLGVQILAVAAAAFGIAKLTK